MINWSSLSEYFNKNIQVKYEKIQKNYRRETKFLWQRLYRGFDDSDLWNLDQSLAQLILPRLKRFRDAFHTRPIDISETEYKNHLDKMVASFEFIASDNYYNLFDQNKLNEVQEGLDLFAKHYMSLWD